MKIEELRKKNINELVKDLEERKSLVRELMFEVAVKQAKNHRDLRNAKKDVARILTIISEKKESKVKNVK